MRVKDENKNEAIFNATIELLNTSGFAGTSMSKIAKKAGLSSSTIYVYFEDKDDMLKKTYLFVKEKMAVALKPVLDQRLSVEDTIEGFLRGLLNYFINNPSYFLFDEQFSNTPLISKLCLGNTMDESLRVFYAFIVDGQEKGILKKGDCNLIIAYCYYPVSFLAKEHLNGNMKVTEELIKQVVESTWAAIRA